MLQLTSNLASVIIKRSPLHVSLCSHWTPSAQTQKSHFVSRGSEMRLCLGMSVYVCFSCVSDRSVSPACESPQAERMCVIAHSVSISAPPPLLKLLVCFYPGWTNVNISEAPKWCLTAWLSDSFWLFSYTRRNICWVDRCLCFKIEQSLLVHVLFSSCLTSPFLYFSSVFSSRLTCPVASWYLILFDPRVWQHLALWFQTWSRHMHTLGWRSQANCKPSTETPLRELHRNTYWLCHWLIFVYMCEYVYVFDMVTLYVIIRSLYLLGFHTGPLNTILLILRESGSLLMSLDSQSTNSSRASLHKRAWV